MKVLFLNLPNEEQITRRYMCSYVSPESLMPPLELLSCASVAREWNGVEVKLIDAIAEKKSTAETIRDIIEYSPDIVLSITGFECFEQDIDIFNAIKQAFPSAIYIYFGHYATHFPEQTLQYSNADFVILGEPEMVFTSLVDCIQHNGDIALIQGIARVNQVGHFTTQGASARIKDPNDLPIPAYDLLPKGDYYYEPLIPRPYGMIQTIRGCPYKCNYCVKSYGTKLSQLSTDRVIEEIKIWKNLHGVKAIRFIDDTFTINRRRVIDLSKAIIDQNLDINWVCLSRTDNLDEEMLLWMKKSGCIRIYFGMETGSQRMLGIYKKEVKKEEAMSALQLCNKIGIETAAFFMSGHPEETNDDINETINFAIDAKIDFVSFNPLTPYPGTEIFTIYKGMIDFSIYPYKNEWKNNQMINEFTKNKKRFYRSVYLSRKTFFQRVSIIKSYPLEALRLLVGFFRYLFLDAKFIISGLKGSQDK